MNGVSFLQFLEKVALWTRGNVDVPFVAEVILSFCPLFLWRLETKQI